MAASTCPSPTRKPALAGPAPSLTLPALSERSRGAWTAARREFVSAHPQHSGSGPAPQRPPASPPPPVHEPPRIKPEAPPADTLGKAAPADSLKKHAKPGAKPKPPKPPGEDAG
jgi:hypothetical protein